MTHRADEDHAIPEYLKDDPSLSTEERSRLARARKEFIEKGFDANFLRRIQNSDAARALQFVLQNFQPAGVPGGVTLTPEASQAVGEIMQAMVANPGAVATAMGKGYVDEIIETGGFSLIADASFAGLPILFRMRDAARAIKAGESVRTAAKIARGTKVIPESVRRGQLEMTRMLDEPEDVAAIAGVARKVPTQQINPLFKRDEFLNVKLTPDAEGFGPTAFRVAEQAAGEPFRVGDKTFWIKRGVDETGPQFNLFDKPGGKLIASYDGNVIDVAEGFRGQGLGEELMFDLQSRFGGTIPVTESRTQSAQRMAERVAQRIEAGGVPQPSIEPIRRAPGIGPIRAVKPVDEAVAASHTKFGGATFDVRTGENMADSKKYAVNPFKDREVKLDHPPTAQEIADYRNANADLLDDGEHFVGTWDDNGEHFLDVTQLVEDKADAERIARASNQRGFTLLDQEKDFPTFRIDDEAGGAIPSGSPSPSAPSAPARHADTAPDVDIPSGMAFRSSMQRSMAEYARRGNNAAPTDQFGNARLLTKEDGLNKEFSSEVARQYDAAVSRPDDPEVQAAYKQFAQEVEEQYKFVTEELGIELIPTTEDPYSSSGEMLRDLYENRKIRVFSGEADHPLLGADLNIKFRGVHDVLGHGAAGNSFGPRGEENAFRMHSELFSPRARQAMATETRGQNSWFNFGPNKDLPVTQRPFAEQKVFILEPELRQAVVPTRPVGNSIERAKAREELLASDPNFRAEMEGRMLASMSPVDLADFKGQTGPNKDKWLRAFTLSPTPREWASLIGLGFDSSDWYSLSRMALARFGEDTPRFTALLAATSPQRSVRENLAFATDIWNRWERLNRPADAKAIQKLFNPKDNTRQNAARALLADDETLRSTKILEEGGLLSGAKVDAFYANLMGESQRVTIDTHIARGVGTDPDVVSRKWKNRGIAASVRAGTAEFNRMSGLPPITPEMGQAAAWGPIRAITELAGGGTAQARLFDLGPESFQFGANSPIARITEQINEGGGNFADLIAGDERIQRALESAGIAPPDITSTPPRPRRTELPEDLIRPEDIEAAGQRVDLTRAAQQRKGRRLERTPEQRSFFSTDLPDFLFQVGPAIGAGASAAIARQIFRPKPEDDQP